MTCTDHDPVRPLRVLHIIDSLGVGGAERGVVRLAEAVGDRPLELTVATLRPRPDSVLEEALEATGSQLVSFPMTSPEAAGMRVAPVVLLRLLRFVRQGDFDIIHTHLNTSDVVGALAGVVSGVPVVSTQHSLRRTAPNPRRERIRRWALCHVAVNVIAVGDSVAEVQREELGGRSITVIPNPFLPPTASDPATRARVRAELGVDDDRPIVLAVGRLEAPKNHHLLIDAVRRVVDHRPDVVLVIAGAGSLADDLAEHAVAVGLGSSVRFLGHRDDIEDVYAAVDLFVSSSDREGMPQSMFEAVAAGLRVVTTDAGSCAEVVGPRGVVVPAGSVPALTSALLDELDRCRFVPGPDAEDRPEQDYGLDEWVTRFACVYERAARAPSS